MGHEVGANLRLESFVMPVTLKRIISLSLGVGVILSLFGAYAHPKRFLLAWLVAWVFWIAISLGALVFVAVHHIGRAGWNVTVRRIYEGVAYLAYFLPLGALVVLVAANEIFPWLDQNYLAAHPVVQAKLSYLNRPFMFIRWVLFFGFWAFIAHKLISRSLRQDFEGGKLEDLSYWSFWSVLGVLGLGLLFSFFSVDSLMSLLPTWYSTIYAIYVFAGGFQAAIALGILWVVYFKHRGFVEGYMTVEHLHDLGKYLKAFTIFWAYIAFSQFLLIWYANIPEETYFYALRIRGYWLWVSFGLLIFKFVIPFVALLPRWAKRQPSHLASVALLVVVTQWVDIYYLVYPNFFEDVVLGWVELGATLLISGAMLALMGIFFQKHSLVPTRDIRLSEALNHHVSYQ